MSPAWILMLLVPGWAPPQDSGRYESALAAAVHHFAREGEAEYLDAILEKHPRLVDALEPFAPGHKPLSTEQSTPLHWAAQYGRPAVAECLIGRGAAVNADRGGGWTPLHLAAQHGDLEIVKLLVAHGAQVDAKTEAVPESSDPQPGASAEAPGAPVQPRKIYPAIPARTALDWANEAKQNAVVNYLKSLKRKAPG